MAETIKDEKAILEKLGIAALNPMQVKAYKAIASNPEVVLLSPTGTGKTLAFLLPIIAGLDPKLEQIQALVVVPSRELAVQIEQVTREMGSGYKVNAVYGGRAGAKDKVELKHPPAILIGTPGRIVDHMKRSTIDTSHITTIVLDEFDKSLEVGFEEDLRHIFNAIRTMKSKILTSATQHVEIPSFIRLETPKRLDFLGESNTKLKLKVVQSPSEDKLETLFHLLKQMGKNRGIVFCNLKDTIQSVTSFLEVNNVNHGCFYGGMEQIDRERSLIKFRNGTQRVLVATDLAARGIDVPELDYIIHYELPFTEGEFVHRNGRTARMNSRGTAYIIKWERESLPEFVEGAEDYHVKRNVENLENKWQTLYINGGRKDKISKGDIAGLFFKQGKLETNELGVIELKQDHAYVSVPSAKAQELIEKLNNSRLKKKKVRISLLE